MMFFKTVCNIVSRFDQYKDDLIEYLNAIGTRTDIESKAKYDETDIEDDKINFEEWLFRL